MILPLLLNILSFLPLHEHDASCQMSCATLLPVIVGNCQAVALGDAMAFSLCFFLIKTIEIIYWNYVRKYPTFLNRQSAFQR